MSSLLNKVNALKIFAGAIAGLILFAGFVAQAKAPVVKKAIKKPTHVTGKGLKPNHKITATSTTHAIAIPVMQASAVPTTTGNSSAVAKTTYSAGSETTAMATATTIPGSTTQSTARRKSIALVRQKELRDGVGKAWSVPFEFETSSTLHKANAYERKAMSAISVAPIYRFSPVWSVSAAITAYREEVTPGNSGLDNTATNLTYTHRLSPTMSWISSGGLVLPTDKNAREETSYQGAARLSTGMNWDDLFLGSSANYRATLTRNFHEYTITNAGEFNVRETLGQTASLSIPVTEQLSFSTTASYTVGRTYLNDMRTKFYAGADLGWSFTKSFSVSVGTSNEGNALKPNGTDSNIAFYDDNISVVKFGLTYLL